MATAADPQTGDVAGAGTGPETTVLVVDDSSVVRQLVTRVIAAEPGFRVVGEAADGRRAVQMARTLRPDVMILDLAMPVLDGYQTIEALREAHLAIDVVVFANVEPERYEQISGFVRAAGAELVVKPTGVADVTQALAKVRDQLIRPLHHVSAEKRRVRRSDPAKRPVANAVVVASSTGGPNALEVMFSAIGELRVPVFVVQHISGNFSGRLADRLNQVCRFPVTEAVDGEHPEPGHVYISPGGIHLTVERKDRATALRLRDLPPVNSCRPSADVLFRSSAEVYGANQVAVVLTGIGQDGLEGCRELSRLGAPVVVQDEATSVVWGMPGAVATAGLADEVLPLSAMGHRVERLTALPTGRASARRGVR